MATLSVQDIELDKIDISSNGRIALDVDSISSNSSLVKLTESIKKHGLLQPIIVHKTETGYMKIAGLRRILSCKQAGYKTISAIVVPPNTTKKELYLFSYEENSQREKLDSVSNIEMVFRCIALYVLEELEDENKYTDDELLEQGKDFLQKARYAKQLKDNGGFSKLTTLQSKILFPTISCLKTLGFTFSYFIKKSNVINFNDFIKDLLLNNVISLAYAKMLNSINNKNTELSRRIQFEIEEYEKQLELGDIKFEDFEALCHACIEKYFSIYQYGSVEKAVYTKKVAKRLSDMASDLSLLSLTDDEKKKVNGYFNEIEELIKERKVGINRFSDNNE